MLAYGAQRLPLSGESLRALLAEAGLPTAAVRSRPSALAACARVMGGDGALSGAVARINASPAHVQRLLDLQNYELVDWREANARVNYRRFFDINGLTALAMERRQVFVAVHALPLRLIAEGLIDGLRIDHVDGLSTPGTYLRTLRQAVDRAARKRPAGVRGPITLHVEKILAADERLPSAWPVDGTTGYDFMAEVGALLHDASGEEPLRKAWAEVSGSPADFEHEERIARAGVLAQSLTPEWSRCARAWRAATADTAAAETDPEPAMRGAIGQVLQSLRIYRSYLADGRGASDGSAALAAAFGQAQAIGGDAFAAARAGLHAQLLDGDASTPEPLRHEAVRRFEQTAAALNAKAVEDTCFYRYGVLLSRNEVGSDPRRFALSPHAFHAAMAERARRWPQSLLATATHDHKRGEDARARLAVLGSRADEYIAHATAWLRELRAIDPTPAPTDLWMLLQTIVAAWPLALGADANGDFDPAALRAFAERVDAWQRKALREAKQHTGWARPDNDYETACQRVTRALLLEAPCASLRAQVGAWAHSLDAGGALAGLAAATVRCTAPGVPDLYQGAEWWDQSLVDPDNRRPVDYARRSVALDDDAAPDELLRQFRDGRIKQRVIRQLLTLRREHPALFARGDYIPLQVTGSAVRLLAFMRRHNDERLLVVVPLPTANWIPASAGRTAMEGVEAAPATATAAAPTSPSRHSRESGNPSLMPATAHQMSAEASANVDTPLLSADALRGTRVLWSKTDATAIEWRDIFTGTRHRAEENALVLQPLLECWPVAVLHATHTTAQDAS